MEKAVKRIITGGPGFGKTSIIQGLQSMKRKTFDEVAREIIKEEMDMGSDHVPWMDNLNFSRKVLDRQIEQFNQSTGITYFDRGAPDILAYIHFNQQDSFSELDDFLKSEKYDEKVFIAPPWEGIYANDLERKESFEEACEIHLHLTRVYTHLGYNLIEIPKLSITERVSFILNHE